MTMAMFEALNTRLRNIFRSITGTAARLVLTTKATAAATAATQLPMILADPHPQLAPLSKPREMAPMVTTIMRLPGQPGAQRVRRVRLHADGQGDGRVQVQRRPDARQRGDQPEPGLLRDAGPAGPHLGRGRGGQDQQRPGPDGPGAGGDRGGPVPSGWSGGPGGGRTAWSQIRRGGAGSVHARGKCGHGSPPVLRGERVGFPGQRGQGGGYLVGGGADVGRGRARLAAVVGVARVGFGDGVAEVPLDPRQGRVPDPVHADLLRPYPGERPAEALPQVVIAAVGNAAGVAVAPQLPVPW